MKKYFDAAASTPLHPLVQAEMKSVMDMYANPGSKHEQGFAVQKKIDAYLKTIADILGVPAHQLVITHGGTDGNKKVLWAMRKRFGVDYLWASALEHSSVLEEILPKKRFVPGMCKSEKEAKCIALMAVNNETGRICDVESLRESFLHITTFSDWVQGVGKIPFDPSHCDFATISAHKFYGPKGVGVLWMRDPNQFPELSGDHHTKDIVAIAGMAKAFELLQSSEHKKASENMVRWQKQIEDSILSIPDSKIHDRELQRVAGIINVAFKGVRGGELQSVLSKKESICVSTGAACTSDILNPTSTIQAIEKDADYQFPIRISLHQFLDDAAVEHFCEVLKYHVEELRK